jgi:hypothetical protein
MPSEAVEAREAQSQVPRVITFFDELRDGGRPHASLMTRVLHSARTAAAASSSRPTIDAQSGRGFAQA